MDTEHDLSAEPETDKPGAKPDDEKSMDDTIRAEYRRLTSPDASDDDAGEEEKSSSRVRGPDGKFTKRQEAEQSGTVAEADSASNVTATQTTAATPEDDYPKTWRKEVRAQWAGVSPQIKAEIKRREENFFDGIRQYQEPAAFGRAIGQEMLPHVETMRRVGVTPQQIARDMMSAWATMVDGQPAEKRTMLLNLATQYGIDIAASPALSSTGEAATQAISPDLSPVLQRVQGIEQMVRQQAAQAAQVASDNATSEVSRFASNAEHKHFSAVQETMAQLIGSGQAATLDDAYDKAVWLVPEVREKLLAEQATKRTQDDAARAAAARKAASVNVAKRGSSPAAPKQGTMEDTIREEYRRLMSQ